MDRAQPNASGIPTGPVDKEPLDYPSTSPSAPTSVEREAILRDVLAAAGVELGAYDDRIVDWFAQFADWGTFAVMTSWVQRAAEAGKPAGE